VWALPEKARPTVAIGANNRVKLVDLKDPASDIRQAIAGNVWLVKEGKNIAATEGKFAITTHPRTAAGVSKDGNKLILAVVDGRRKDATGMPLKDLADLMLSQGAFTALNLDGGGSSEMVIRDPETGKLHVVNKPSDARERSVANVLGISVKGARQSEEVVLDRLAPATQKSDAAQ
jgi:exopolysaccharide biosynthesis protein